MPTLRDRIDDAADGVQWDSMDLIWYDIDMVGIAPCVGMLRLSVESTRFQDAELPAHVLYRSD